MLLESPGVERGGNAPAPEVSPEEKQARAEQMRKRARIQMELMRELYERDHPATSDENLSQQLEIAEYWINNKYSDFFSRLVDSPMFQEPPFGGNVELITLDLVGRFINDPKLLEKGVDYFAT